MAVSKTRTQTRIHPTAVVSKEAEIGNGVEIGPYSIIGPKVKIGAGTHLAGHVVIEGQTQIGERCRLFTGVCIGFPAQTRKSEVVRSKVVIGDDNIFREYATVNAGMKDGSETRIGDRNTFMINSHVAHDCLLGSDIVIANAVALAGHVQVEDAAVIGGLVGVHQFVRIGKMSMVGGLSKVVMDVAPFSIHDGQPATFHGVNAVGLRRNGFSSSRMMPVKSALKALFGSRINFERAVPRIEKQFKGNEDVRYLLDFIERSKRGMAR